MKKYVYVCALLARTVTHSALVEREIERERKTTTKKQANAKRIEMSKTTRKNKSRGVYAYACNETYMLEYVFIKYARARIQYSDEMQ